MASAGGAGSGAAGAASGDVAAAGAAARPLAAAAPASGDHAALSKRVAAFVAAEGGAGGGVSGPFLAAAFDDFDAAPKNALALNSVTQNGPLAGALNRSAVVAGVAKQDYAIKIDGKEMKATSQKSSGRCWLFALCNVLRLQLARKYKLPTDFQLSQTYLFFWDKVEKSNFFLEQALDTADEPVDGRLVQYLLKAPINDGGQFDMIVNLINKYGVVPRDAMPEAHSSTLSRHMNWLVTNKLREACAALRARKAAGETMEQLRAAKLMFLNTIVRMLVINLGRPPETFDWSYRTTDTNEFVRRAGLTPRAFYDDIIRPLYDVNSKVSLVNDPRNEYNRLMTVDRLNNCVGGVPVRYINVAVDDLKAAARATLEAGDPVWFGCDVGKRYNRDLALMDTDLYDFELVYGATPGMSKAERLTYHESLMTHAMVFTAVDTDPEDESRTTAWRVENSWGPDLGDGGFFRMTDKWFNEFMYQVVVDKSVLTASQLAALEQEPVVLPPWDPMGSLACLMSGEDEEASPSPSAL